MNQPNQRPSTASPFSTTTLNSSTTIPTQSTPTTMNQGFHEQQHNNGDEENKVHQNQHDQSTDQFINTDAIEKRVWLVKLPKFLAEEWYQQPPNTELGLVRIHNVDTTKQQRHVTLHLQSNTSSKIPKNYTLKFGMDEAHNVHVFTEDPLSGTAISIAGKINHEVNITPIIDDDYKNMIKSRTTDYSQSQRTIKLMDKNEGKNQQFVVPNMMNRTFGFGSMVIIILPLILISYFF